MNKLKLTKAQLNAFNPIIQAIGLRLFAFSNSTEHYITGYHSIIFCSNDFTTAGETMFGVP